MASVEKDATSGVYRVRFRYGGRHFMRSLKTKDRREADVLCARVDGNLRLLERGYLTLPHGGDVGRFVLSDGKMDAKPVLPKAVTLGELFALYAEHFTEGAKEANTRKVERIHAGHLTRLIGTGTPLGQVSAGVVQSYINARAKEAWRGRPINPITVRKEVGTLQAVWAWASKLGHATAAYPGRGVTFPKSREKPPFRTYDEIMAVVARGGLSKHEVRAQWDGLFLTVAQVDEVLGHVRAAEAAAWLYPFFLAAAHTGARKSELLRSRVEDFQFDNRVVTIREKKRSREKQTFRTVDLTPALAEVMRAYFAASHPGGPVTFSCVAGEPVSDSTARGAFRRVLRKSKWRVLRGYHAFRHSFASNLAAAGIDQRVIDDLMGHQTEAMRARYRHLFPAQRRQAVALVFGDPGVR